jgi:hypothetical protein
VVLHRGEVGRKRPRLGLVEGERDTERVPRVAMQGSGKGVCGANGVEVDFGIVVHGSGRDEAFVEGEEKGRS